MVAVVIFEPSFARVSFLFTFLFYPFTMDSLSIHEFSTPKGEFLEPPQSSKPITASSFELRPGFVAMVREQSFSGFDDENPYHHLREFEQLCSCLSIAGMAQEILRWKLFPFSLAERAKQWYDHNIGKVNAEWVELRDRFCLAFFPYVSHCFPTKRDPRLSSG